MSPIALSLGKRSVLRMSRTEVAAELEVSPPRIRNGFPSTISVCEPGAPSKYGACAATACGTSKAASRTGSNLFIIFIAELY